MHGPINIIFQVSLYGLDKNPAKRTRYKWITEKKEYVEELNAPTIGAVIFRDEDDGLYIDNVFVGPHPVHHDTCLTHSIGFYTLFHLKE
jgi:hypothetical protein